MCVDATEDPDQAKRQQNKVKSDDWIGDEWVEGFVRKIVCVIKSITHLAKGRKAREEHQGGGLKQKNRLIGIARPSQTHHGRPLDTAEFLPAGDALSLIHI